MKKTEILGLPIYDAPESDLFKFQDWNEGNQKIDNKIKEFGSSLDLKVNQTDIGFIDAMLPIGSVNPKVLMKASDNEYRVFSRKHSKPGYTYMKFTKGSGSIADSQNYGGTWDLLRLTGVYELSELIAYYLPSTWTSSQLRTEGANDFQYYGLNVGYSPSTVQLISNNSRNNRVEQWFEFTVNIKKNHNGILPLGFYATNGACKNVEISINGTKVRENVSVQNSTSMIKIIPLDVSNHLGDITIRIGTPTSPNNDIIHFLGYNSYHVNELNSDIECNKALYTATQNNYISQSTGANDYAINDGKWLGSFHGGETNISLSVRMDNVDCTTLATNDFVVGNKFEIIQKTNIADKVISNSITKVFHDSTHSFECYFEVANPFIISFFYTSMTCSNTAFSNVVYPLQISTLSGDTVLPNFNKVIQLNAVTNQQIISVFSHNDKYNADTPLYIRYASGSYCKVYHGKVVGKSGILTSTGFSSARIFD